MQQDILINWSPQETRVAVVENGAIQELHVERTLERGLVGNIYLGKVSRVLPGMQSAFIDIAWSAPPSCTWPTCTPRTARPPSAPRMRRRCPSSARSSKGRP